MASIIDSLVITQEITYQYYYTQFYSETLKVQRQPESFLKPLLHHYD